MSARSIWKFPVEVTDHAEVAIPQGAEFLHLAAETHDKINIWARVDVDADGAFRPAWRP